MSGTDDDLHRRLDRAEDRLDSHDTRIIAIERFQSWLLGLAAGAGGIIGLLAEWFRKKLGM